MNPSDPQLGAIARARGWVTQAQLSECLELKKQRAADGQPPFVGQILVEKGYLSPERLQFLVLHQERYRISCPHCMAKLLAPELPPGRKIVCPKCAGEIILGGAGRPGRKSQDLPAASPAAKADAPVPDDDPLIGRTLQGYRIEGRLGAGGMGTVYRATQLNLNRAVAVKVMQEKTAAPPDFIERFKREAMAAARMNHPNIVQVYDAGHEGKLLFFSMELLEGETLADRLHAAGTLPPAKALQSIREITKALVYAHGHGVIHRDIKPDNILITKEGRVKLADLGLAKAHFDGPMEHSLTMSGAVIGTAYYMSPEQTRDTRTVDGRTDIYSLGATFFHAVTGTYPFDADSPVEVLVKIQKGPVPAAHEINPEVPWIYSQVISRMMAHDPKDRFQTAAELLKSLDALARASTAHGQDLAAEIPAMILPPAHGKFPARWAAVAAAVAVFAFALGRLTRPALDPTAVGPPPTPARTPAPEITPLQAPTTAAGAERIPSDPAESVWELFESFRKRHPEEPERERPILQWLAAELPRKSAARQKARDRLAMLPPPKPVVDASAKEEEPPELTQLRESVERFCLQGEYAQALQAVEEAYGSRIAAHPKAAPFLVTLPSFVQQSAEADFQRLQREVLARSMEQGDFSQVEPLLAQSIQRYEPFKPLQREANDLLSRIQTFRKQAPQTPPPPPRTEKPPPREDPKKKPKKKSLKESYFQSTEDLKDWDLLFDRDDKDRENMPLSKNNLFQIKNGGIALRSPEKGRDMIVVRYMGFMKNPESIQAHWQPSAKSGFQAAVLLEHLPERGPRRDPHPAIVLHLEDEKRMFCEFPQFDRRMEPHVLTPDPGGYRIVIEFLRAGEKVEGEDQIKVSVYAGSNKTKPPLVAETFAFPCPDRVHFAVAMGPEDVLGDVVFIAEEFIKSR